MSVHAQTGAEIDNLKICKDFAEAMHWPAEHDAIAAAPQGHRVLYALASELLPTLISQFHPGLYAMPAAAVSKTI